MHRPAHPLSKTSNARTEHDAKDGHDLAVKPLWRFSLVVYNHSRATIKRVWPVVMLLILALYAMHNQQQHLPQHENLAVTESSYQGTMNCEVTIGPYQGPTYSLPGTTLSSGHRCIMQSKWLRVMQHRVSLPIEKTMQRGLQEELHMDENRHQDDPEHEQNQKQQNEAESQEGQQEIADWLFIDSLDRINVLVEKPITTTSSSSSSSSPQSQWLVFRQTKYALSGLTSYAVVGGFVEANDPNATVAALREVEEEMNVTCHLMQPLGTFRTDVNRGMGYVHSFMARKCHYLPQTANASEDDAEEEQIGGADGEAQDLVTLTTTQVQQALLEGQFMEVQWSNTVAMALLTLQQEVVKGASSIQAKK